MSENWIDPSSTLLLLRPDSVSYHKGSMRDFFHRHERHVAAAIRGHPRHRRALMDRLFSRVADDRTLREAWLHLSSRGGCAPGLNRLTYDDFSEREALALVRYQSYRLRSGNYQPDTPRLVTISKGPNRGNRTLELLNVEDRLVERAVHRILSPVLDHEFLDTSFGFRPGRSRWHALRHAESIARQTGRLCWLTEDVRDAFPSIPLGPMLEVLNRYVSNSQLNHLISQLLFAEQRCLGLRQGGALSPLLLNLYLHDFLDRPWREQHPDIPLLRFADDILLCCRDSAEARMAYTALEGLLRSCNLRLKASPDRAIQELNGGQRTAWLGYDIGISPDGHLDIRIPSMLWPRLEERLFRCHTERWAPLRANQVLASWIQQLGPAYPGRTVARRCYRRIARIATAAGFDEIPAQVVLLRIWRHAKEDWDALQLEPCWPIMATDTAPSILATCVRPVSFEANLVPT